MFHFFRRNYLICHHSICKISRRLLYGHVRRIGEGILRLYDSIDVLKKYTKHTTYSHIYNGENLHCKIVKYINYCVSKKLQAKQT